MVVHFYTGSVVKKFTSATINMALELEKDLKLGYEVGIGTGAACELL